MPLYEYRCEECSKAFEMLRKMSDADSGVACPKCESTRVNRQLSSFAAVSTGSDGASAQPMGCARPGCGSRFACGG